MTVSGFRPGSLLFLIQNKLETLLSYLVLLTLRLETLLSHGGLSTLPCSPISFFDIRF
jgi:hypothetical protein